MIYDSGARGLAALTPFPAHSRIRWRRVDVSGQEDARVDHLADGWRLTGELQVVEADAPAQLRYRIECHRDWRTRSALIVGEIRQHRVRFVLTTDGEGHWAQDGIALPHLTGAVDIDLGFTPATNTLPIRRLALAVGATAAVRSAWLRFPELRLEPLEQTYTREGERVYRYVAQVDGEPFTARLETDAYGRVLRYEGLWEVA